MGGQGSGNWYRWQKKDTVEGCRWLDANRWMREGILKDGIHQSGGWSWLDAQTGEKTSSIGYQVNTATPYKWLRLYYTITRTGEEMDYRVNLVNTRPNYGGLRWWFVCPLSVNGVSCNRRVGKIYLPYGGKYYGCRICYVLTYTSCQESDKRVNWLRKNPAAFMALMEDVRSENVSTRNLILALKVMK